MAKKKREKIRHVTIKLKKGGRGFMSFLRPFSANPNNIQFSDVAKFRQLLSNEKAKILYTLKEDKPDSIYELAKIVGRDFKSVRQDVRLLQHFGLVILKKSAKGKRKSLKPIINLDKLEVVFEV